jgi:hypothetical protein
MEEAWGTAGPGSGEARRKVHSQPQDCLELKAGRRGGEVRIAALRRARSSFLVAFGRRALSGADESDRR